MFVNRRLGQLGPRGVLDFRLLEVVNYVADILPVHTINHIP